MRIADLSWKQVEEYLKRDDRAVLPIGSTEQHAYLSLATDNILAERVAIEAAEPLGVPVFPVVAYGITPHFRDYPGSVTLRTDTFLAVIGDILDSLAHSGFKRVLIVNGHGGNTPAQSYVGEWMTQHPGVRIKFHSWWNAPLTIAKVKSIDPVASHASWMESFTWTRVPGVAVPKEQKQMVDWPHIQSLGPSETRRHLGDGNFGGLYRRADSEMDAIWSVAVEETRGMMVDGWQG